MSTNFPTVMKRNELAQALQQSQVTETNANSGGSEFIRFDFESGEFDVGRERDDITGDEVLVNTASIKHGWILWSGGRPTKSFVPFNQAIPVAPEPVFKGKNQNGQDEFDYPSEGRSFEGALYEDGQMVQFDTSSYGGRKGIDTLLGHIKQKAALGGDYLYPLVQLTSESYANAKRGGKLTFNPVFKIVAWCNEDGEKEPEQAEAIAAQPEQQGDEEPVAEEQPKRRRRKAAAG